MPTSIFNFILRSGPAVAIGGAVLIIIIAMSLSTAIPGILAQVTSFIWTLIAVGAILSLLWFLARVLR
jgi:hypothetical protein